MSKFTELFTTDNKSILQKLACFVHYCFALRVTLYTSIKLIVPSTHAEILGCTSVKLLPSFARGIYIYAELKILKDVEM